MKHCFYFFMILFVPSWARAAQFVSTDTPSLKPLVGQTATNLQNGEVLICGDEIDGLSADCEIYDPETKDFRYTDGTMNLARAEAAAAALDNGKVIIGGGITSGIDGQGVITPQAELFDPVTETFTPTGSMNEPRWPATAVFLYGAGYGKVLFLGGGQLTNSAEVYDPDTETWTYTGPLADSTWLSQPSAVEMYGSLLVVGGQNRVAELYDSGSNTFSLTGSLNNPDYNNYNGDTGQAVFIPKDKALFVGVHWGDTSGEMFAETYDPGSGTWTTAASPLNLHTNVSLAVLPSGKVLLAGGWSSGSDWISSKSEIYDPDTDTWSLTTSMLEPRAFYSVNALMDGTVLFAGGFDNQTALSSAEIYVP